MNILITTQMRVGSTWLCDMLKAILGKSWDFWPRAFNISSKEFERRISVNDNLFVKMHYADPKKICAQIKDSNTKVISITRNLPDIIVSKAFYSRYDKGVDNLEWLKEIKKVKEDINSDISDKEYVNLFCDTDHTEGEVKMWLQYNDGFKDPNYILLHYEDMINNTYKEMVKVCNFLEIPVDKELKSIISRFSFKNKTGRERGDEIPNAFLRKGIVGDHRNYLNNSSIKKIKKCLRRFKNGKKKE